MSATVTIEFDDNSTIAFFDVADVDIDGMVDNYLYKYPSSQKV